MAIGSTVQFSGADATSGDVDVVWSEVTAGEEYAGVADGTTIFSLSVDDDGTVTFTQSGVLDHTRTDSAAPYTTDILTLDDGQISVQKSVTVTDGDDDGATSSASVDLGGNFAIGDDGPDIEVNDVSGTIEQAELGLQGTWPGGPGADDGSLTSVTLNNYSIGEENVPGVDVSLTKNGDVWEGSITDDFTDDGIDNEQTINFTLEFNDDGTYDFVLVAPPESTTTFSTDGGQLDAGGPDAVRTLELAGAGNETVVFFAVDFVGGTPINPTQFDPTYGALSIDPIYPDEPTSPSDVDLEEAELQPSGDPLTWQSYLNEDFQLNLSQQGIGNLNNNFELDESFIVNPLDQTFDNEINIFRVYIANSATGFDDADDTLSYRIYYSDGTISDFSDNNVTESDLQDASGNKRFFEIGEEDGKSIDAVQLWMEEGKIKIPAIEFVTSQTFDPEDLSLNFTVVETDNEGDTDSDTFMVTVGDPEVA